MQESELPKKRSFYNQMIGIRVDDKTKKELDDLRDHHQVDTAEWIRQLIRKGLDQIKNSQNL